ncbi:MAG TPA: DNA mismatch repair protein MutS [archaeon]|nr:DNA mismatch repair protein MutS [archaeon]
MEKQNLTPMMKQYLETKKEYPDGILLFRAGDFYEMFYDDAKIASQLLNITLTKRGKGETEAPLAGIPYHSIDPYITKLIKYGKKVIICEQIEDPKLAKGLVKRAVTRIITPSTLFTDSYENNYLCSIVKLKELFGFSLVDITTGEFKINSFDNFNEILNELLLIKPKEIILSKNILNDFSIIENIKRTIPNVIINYTDNQDVAQSANKLLEHFNTKSLAAFGLVDKNEIILSSYNALKYLKDTQFSDLKYISEIKQYNLNKFIRLDNKTVNNLELVSNIRDKQQKNSLFDLINETRTAMGYRKLYFDLLHPLTNKEEIIKINEAVKAIKENVFIIEELKQQLSYIGDLDKIISKIGFGNANPRDLIALKQSLEVLPNLRVILKETESIKLQEIRNNLSNLNAVVELIDSAIINEPPISVREGGFIEPSFSKELFDLVNINKTTNSWLLEYEAELKQKTNIKSIKLKFNKIFGYYIEIPKAQTTNIPDYLDRKQTLVNCERYTTKELSEKESMVLHAKERREELEFNIFTDVCKQIIIHQEEIKKTATLLGSLDEYFSFAFIGNQYDYISPEHTHTDELILKDLRHPLIEQQTSFIPNDCVLDSNNRTMIITGPNMAGKSSYMRSVCIALILGHTGSFIPASFAKIGKIDGIFTRIGASDDISRGQSTFLVEMSEVAYIINNATKNSLVILDEVGRGTSTFDGISIAWSIVDYLNNKTQCKSLVATHYHILNKMEEIYAGINNFHVTAKEEGDSLHFYHKLQKGGINKSYGLQVARLAGINKEIIEKAQVIQRDLENDSFLKTPGKIIKSSLNQKDD